MDLIKRTLEIDIPETFDESQVYKIILERVRALLHQDPNLLFSYLYRLDILEHKINHVIQQQKSIPIDEGLSKLILERQKERVETKEKYKQDPIEGWEF